MMTAHEAPRLRRVAMTQQSAIAELMECSRAFDGTRRARKAQILKKLRHSLPSDAAELLSLHESLLFIAAFPDDASIRALAGDGLRRVALAAAQICSTSKRAAKQLQNSGIAGSMVEHSYTLDMLGWLADRAKSDVQLAWADDSLGDAFDELLPLIAGPLEYDGLLDVTISTREWLTLARGRQSELNWLLAQLERMRSERCGDAQAVDQLYERAEVYVRWTLRRRALSRTFCRFPARRYFFHANSARPMEPSEVIRSPVPVAIRLSTQRAQELIDCARATLAVRCRETDPVTYAEPRDVLLCNLDRGIDVMLIGMQPGRRLPIEGFVGYVAAKNRVPIAYGGGWILFDRCTIGINLFDTFRGGESAQIFAQVLRAYRSFFKIASFVVDPYQVGEGNEEAIRSGAFWFYYRIGFRPVDGSLTALAEREALRIKADRSHRTSKSVLRRLAGGQLRMDLAGAAQPVSLESVSLALTRHVGRRCGGDWATAQSLSMKIVERALRARGRSRWPEPERAAFESLAPLMAMIPDLDRWPERDRISLRTLMRAKGGPRETAYLQALRRHERLREFMATLR